MSNGMHGECDPVLHSDRIASRHREGLVAEDLFQYVKVAPDHHELAGKRVPEIVEM